MGGDIVFEHLLPNHQMGLGRSGLLKELYARGFFLSNFEGLWCVEFFFFAISLEDWPGACRLGGDSFPWCVCWRGSAFFLFHVVEISRVRIHDCVPEENDRIII